MTDRQRGYGAFHPGGNAAVACPYSDRAPNREKWLNGWEEARYDWNSKHGNGLMCTPCGQHLRTVGVMGDITIMECTNCNKQLEVNEI